VVAERAKASASTRSSIVSPSATELLVGNLDCEVRSDGVGELGMVLDLLNHADRLGRHLLVELHNQAASS
jgi:hypothetical protein